MKKIIEELKEHFKNTPQEELEKEWEKYSIYNKIGPTVDEYLDAVERYKKVKFMTDDNENF